MPDPEFKLWYSKKKKKKSHRQLLMFGFACEISQFQAGVEIL
jgi:hypothetical protein